MSAGVGRQRVSTFGNGYILVADAVVGLIAFLLFGQRSSYQRARGATWGQPPNRYVGPPSSAAWVAEPTESPLFGGVIATLVGSVKVSRSLGVTGLCPGWDSNPHAPKGKRF